MAPPAESPSQTAGPFVHIGLIPSLAGLPQGDLGSGPLYDEGAAGERIAIAGRIIDGAGMAIADAVVEAWHADANGLYNAPSEWRGSADPHVRGFGRSAMTGEPPAFAFRTIKPGPVRIGDVVHAPHIALWIVARGINLGLHTRLYFPEEEAANAADPVLARIEQESRRNTLIARREGDRLTFDIVLQGEGETVFLDV